MPVHLGVKRPASQEQTRARDNEAFASVIDDSHRTVKLRFSEYLLFLKFRDRLDATGFRSGKGDFIAGMQRV
jgi:hypothetical protein